MIDHPDLFTAAREAASTAIQTARDHADPDWYTNALDAGRRLARTRATFTSDDVRREAGEGTHEPRALGAVMRQLRREGVCTPTPEYRESGRVEAHNRPMRVWRSLDRTALPE